MFKWNLLLFSVFLSLYQAASSPASVGVELTPTPVFDENSLRSQDMDLGARAVSFSQMVSELMKEARKRIDELMSKSTCVRTRVAHAQQETIESLVQVRGCSKESALKAADIVFYVVPKVADNLLLLLQTGAQVTVDLLKCIGKNDRSKCSKEVMDKAQVTLEKLNAASTASFESASNDWSKVIANLKGCLANGVQVISCAERQFYEDVIRCLQ